MKAVIAYIDPGLGALVWQSIVAAFVGFFFYLKKTRQWIVGGVLKLFRRRPSTRTPAPPAPALEQANVKSDAEQCR